MYLRISDGDGVSVPATIKSRDTNSTPSFFLWQELRARFFQRRSASRPPRICQEVSGDLKGGGVKNLHGRPPPVQREEVREFGFQMETIL